MIPRIALTCVFITIAATGASIARDEPSVPRWQPRDFTFHVDEKMENPFAVALTATIKGPDGATFEAPGFFDGSGNWTVRVAPQREGEWSLSTHSEIDALDDLRATLTCVESDKSRGGLRVDPTRPRHFVRDDGSRFFPLPYECGWLWALDLGKPDIKTTEAFLDRIAAHGFNYVILNAYAHDTSWRSGKTSDDDYGPPPAYAWEGTNARPDHSRFNLDYWKHYDRVVRALADRGMIAHVFIKVYNKKVRWPTRGGKEDDQYFRWLVARYAPFPNVVWDFSKEAHNEKDLAYKTGRLALLRRLDPYHRPVTVHDDNAGYESGAFDGLVDFRVDQQHSKWRETLLDQRARSHWPVFNVEFGYEQGPDGPEDKTYRIAQSAEEVATRAWEVSMAGGYTAYYYTYTAWDVVRPDDLPPGYGYFKNLRDSFERTAYWRLEPSDDLAGGLPCLAEPGREYLVFQRASGPVVLTVEKASAPLPVEWFHPFTSERRPAGNVANGATTLAPPDGWRGAPAVLHVGGKAR